MTAKAMSLKSKINAYAKQNGITAQVVLQNYMFERFLVRLAKSEFKDKFVIKGGMLVAKLVGLDIRSTMDLDTTLIHLILTEVSIREYVKKIAAIDVKDSITFSIKSVEAIMKEDLYGGFCVKMDAVFETIVTPLSIDVSTGDAITPEAVSYEFPCLFDDEEVVSLMGYNIESVLAEKVETILRRSIFNTRPRDFYDSYILGTTQSFDQSVFEKALTATAKHRNSFEKISDTKTILNQIENSPDLKEAWKKYQAKFTYAKAISYENIIANLKKLLKQT